MQRQQHALSGKAQYDFSINVARSKQTNQTQQTLTSTTALTQHSPLHKSETKTLNPQQNKSPKIHQNPNYNDTAINLMSTLF